MEATDHLIIPCGFNTVTSMQGSKSGLNLFPYTDDLIIYIRPAIPANSVKETVPLLHSTVA